MRDNLHRAYQMIAEFDEDDILDPKDSAEFMAELLDGTVSGQTVTGFKPVATLEAWIKEEQRYLACEAQDLASMARYNGDY